MLPYRESINIKRERERSDGSCRRNKMKISIRMMNTCFPTLGLGLGGRQRDRDILRTNLTRAMEAFEGGIC